MSEKQIAMDEKADKHFDVVLIKLENNISRSEALASRAYQKSIKIAASGIPFQEEGLPSYPESIIGSISYLSDRVSMLNGILERVVDDLEKAIG